MAPDFTEAICTVKKAAPRHIPSKTGRDPKLAKILDAVAVGNWDLAIQLAAKVTAMGKYAEAISRGRQAIANPDFYRELGKDPLKLRDEAISALKERLKSE